MVVLTMPLASLIRGDTFPPFPLSLFQYRRFYQAVRKGSSGYRQQRAVARRLAESHNSSV
jgi:hypothetical protein